MPYFKYKFWPWKLFHYYWSINNAMNQCVNYRLKKLMISQCFALNNAMFEKKEILLKRCLECGLCGQIKLNE